MLELFEWLYGEWWLAAIFIAGSLVASVHALLFRRNIQTTIAWVGFIWLVPILGALLYVLLGVNRISRLGAELREELEGGKEEIDAPQSELKSSDEAPELAPYQPLIHLVERVTDLPLLAGNRVTPLVNGMEAYPAMLAAIRSAEQSISLESYIFDNDRAGREFLTELEAAQQRGVAIRVLIDDVGSRYTRPTMVWELQRKKIPCARFLPTRTPLSISYANLRNHRKILVVDGKLGFTGGMNIRERCRIDWNPKHPVKDLHFQIEGPVVGHLQEAFALDWKFTTGEVLAGDAWFPQLTPDGDTWARGVPDGPDEDIDQLPLTIQGAISIARRRVDIVTPYFLPDPPTVAALNIAALRGVRVRILIPERTNIHLVQWAAAAQLHNVLGRGCQVYAMQMPFDHSKLMLVDDHWSLVGSSNLDPRSLRLNFEFNIECYCRELSKQLSALFDEKLAGSAPITLEKLAARPVLIRLRDSLASLLTPYL